MRLVFLRPAAVLATIVAVLPFAVSGGCDGNTACFTFSQAQFAASGNGCPAQAGALVNFTDPNCPGPVVSVNGPGTFDGELCCYPVTYQDITPDCNMGMGTGMGGGFSMGFSAAFSSSSVAPPPFGTGGSSAGCGPTCEGAIFSGTPPCGEPPLVAYDALLVCAGCDVLVIPDGGPFDDGGTGGGGSTSCSSTCQFFCESAGATEQCLACLQSQCAMPLTTCMGL